MRRVLDKFLYWAHTILTYPGGNLRKKPTSLYLVGIVLTESIAIAGVEHRLAKLVYPQINGQVKRMDRILRELRSSAFNTIIGITV